jgi:hypothetical protein
MSNFDVNCPIGYGCITFVGGGTGRICPVSGQSCCLDCNVRPSEKNKADNQPKLRDDVKK